MLRSTFTAGELTGPEAEAIAAVQRRSARETSVKTNQPDRFEYHLHLPEGQVVISEEELPDTLRPLVTRLVERARQPSGTT